MKTLPFAFFVSFVFFVSACTTTSVKRYGQDGKPAFEASNISIGMDRENISLDLMKTEKETALQVGIGKSGGSQSFQAAIKKLEEALVIMKGAAAPGL